MTTVFYAFRDSPQRRRALATPPGSPERYLLFGLDQLRERGWTTRHDLERAGRPPGWARASGGALKAGLERAGGYGGDFATVLASLRTANRADVVLSTVDTVGIPLMLLNNGREGPASARVHRDRASGAAGASSVRTVCARCTRERLASSAVVLAYSEYEASELRAFLHAHGESTRVEFVPFGVDEQAFAPSVVEPSADVVTVGADPHRDLELFVASAAEMSNRTFRLVTTSERRRARSERCRRT